MSLNMLSLIAKGAKDSSGPLLSALNLRTTKSGMLDNSTKRIKPEAKQVESINKGKTSLLWNSLASKNTAPDDFLFDRSNNVIEYYRNRCDYEQSEKKGTLRSSISSLDCIGLTKDNDKSLYSWLATKQMSSPSKPTLKYLNPPSEKLITSPPESSFNNQKSFATYSNDSKKPYKKCNLSQLRSSVSAPSLWALQKPPPKYAPNSQGMSKERRAKLQANGDKINHTSWANENAKNSDQILRGPTTFKSSKNASPVRNFSYAKR